MTGEGGSHTLAFILLFSAAIGIIAAILLYRAAHVKQEVRLDAAQSRPTSQADTSQITPSIREKVKKIALHTLDPESATKSITKIVEEQAQELVKDIKEEYSVKYQVAIQEKNKEVDNAKREYRSVQEKYQNVEKQYKKSESEKKTTEAVVRSIAEGLVVVNNKGEVLLMNSTAEKLLGVQKEKKLGKSLMEESRDNVVVSMLRESEDGTEKTIEYRSKDENVRKIIRSSSAVIQNEDGQTVGMVNILTDVTKQKELDEVKNKFVSNVTHELRTPIVAMQKAITILQSPSAGPLNETQSNFVNIVSRNLGHLSRLVEDILDIAKIDSGKMRLKIVTARLDKVIQDACETLDTWAKSKNIQILREIEKNLPEIPCDSDKVTQVLNNLIGNAIKFTPTGGKITVVCSVADSRHVQVKIVDTGVGIAKANLPKLFRRFEQFGDQQGITGTGLGLSISKEIVEKHGGSILAESQEGKGTTFIFTLPFKQPRMSGG